MFFNWYLNLKPNPDLWPHRSPYQALCVSSFLGSGGMALLWHQSVAQDVMGACLDATYVGDPRSLSLEFVQGRESLFSKVTSCKKWRHGEGYDMWTGGKVKGGGQLFQSADSSFSSWKRTAWLQVWGVVAFPFFCSFRIKSISLSAIYYLHRVLGSHWLYLVMHCWGGRLCSWKHF